MISAPDDARRVEPLHLYYEAPHYYRPQLVDAPSIFVAGGITGCERWHDHAIATLAASPNPLVVFNPNRERFPIHDPAAGWEQVSWEQHHLHLADLTLFWFPACDAKVTQQPIAMFELGQALGNSGRRLVVGADPGYPRVADVRMLTQIARPGLPVYSSLDDVLHATIADVDRLRAAPAAA